MSPTDIPHSQRRVVPLVDLQSHTQRIKKELLAAVEQVMDEAAFVSGPFVEKFERRFAEYCQVPECVALNTGTSALHLATQCLHIGPGDEVITVAMSFIATAWPILYLGARPVFVDIDLDRRTMDPGQLEAAITPKTKAVVPVHLYGQCADMDPILQIANRHGLAVIEDCAQAHGAEYKGRRAGSMGTIGCFSFYPSKNLGACGEGGALTTRDPDLAARARRLRDHAQVQRFVHNEVGYNYRMDGLHGAMLSVKLGYLEGWTEARRAAAAQYDRLLQGSRVVTPPPCPDGRHVYHLYVIRERQRDALREHLEQHDILASVHYPVPIHLQAPFRSFGYSPGDLPVTEELCRTCLSLPLYPEISDGQIQHVATTIRSLKS